ncbi:Zn-dependent hydrolase [Alteromonas lipolytica]|nr:Zn-dependent hydrolase [Alteromonas lipolytica]
MPLPFVLDHINLYVLEGDDGMYIVDTGVQCDKSKAIWQRCLATFDKPLAGVIATHMHPDHCGLIGWLCREYKVPLYMSALEYYGAIAYFSPNPGADTSVEADYFVQAGLSAEQANSYVRDHANYEASVSPIPLAYQRLESGNTLTIGARTWQIHTYGGHSPEHVCLFDPKDNLLIGGDQILPYISPNIGVYSREPEANPLTEYFASLKALKQFPADCLVLPAHNQPYTGLHSRCDELVVHHQELLEKLTQHCMTEKTLVACLPVLYTRELSGQVLFFALAEGLAHLNYLVKQGALARRLDEQGMYYYKTLG